MTMVCVALLPFNPLLQSVFLDSLHPQIKPFIPQELDPFISIEILFPLAGRQGWNMIQRMESECLLCHDLRQGFHPVWDSVSLS